VVRNYRLQATPWELNFGLIRRVSGFIVEDDDRHGCPLGSQAAMKQQERHVKLKFNCERVESSAVCVYILGFGAAMRNMHFRRQEQNRKEKQQ